MAKNFNSITNQKAQNLKYGNILDTKAKIWIKLHVSYVLPETGECNTILNAQTLYRHLELYGTHQFNPFPSEKFDTLQTESLCRRQFQI